jgi:hypothetical protein
MELSPPSPPEIYKLRGFFFFFAGVYGQRFWKREMNAKEFEFHVAGRQPGLDEGDTKTFRNVEDTICLSYS